LRLVHARPGYDFDAAIANLREQRLAGIGAQIDHRRDLHVGGQQIQRGAITVAVGSQHDPRGASAALRIDKSTAGPPIQHYAGQVVVAENSGLLEHAARNHHG